MEKPWHLHVNRRENPPKLAMEKRKGKKTLAFDLPDKSTKICFFFAVFGG
jgi:hypothetical protein